MFDTYRHLQIERRGKILVIRIGNPPLSLMTPDMHTELSTVFADAGRDPDSTVIVLTGSEKAFSAGGDFADMEAAIADPHLWRRTMEEARAIIHGLLDLDKPVIARVNGHAMGLGASLAVLCDVSFMVDKAKIADPHVSIGLSAGDGGALMWPLLIGFNKAKELLFTGGVLTGTEAAALGLINHAVPAEELDARAYGFAEKLAAGAPLAINGTKRSINLVLKRLFDGIVEAQLGIETNTFLSGDHGEAVRAVSARRTPEFRGS